MKNEVTIEQAKALFDNKVFFNSSDEIEYAWQDAGNPKSTYHKYYIATMGDLIDWICKETNLTWVVLFDRMAEECNGLNPDLIKTLVDTCICLKDNT